MDDNYRQYIDELLQKSDKDATMIDDYRIISNRTSKDRRNEKN